MLTGVKPGQGESTGDFFAAQYAQLGVVHLALADQIAWAHGLLFRSRCALFSPGIYHRLREDMEISHLDHLVLTVADIERTCSFYHRALGLQVERFGQGRTALKFGRQKINLHQQGREFEPKAASPTPGSADLCFIATTPVDQILTHLRACDVEILAGPLGRTGATGRLNSIYVRDPDDNLIEIANLLKSN